MRRAQGIHRPGVEVVYVPEAFGNRADSSPVRIWYVVDEHRKRRVEARTGDLPPSGRNVSTVEYTRILLEELVVRVEGYQDAGGVAILDGFGLARNGEREIQLEVGAMFVEQISLTSAEKKTFAPSSDSSEVAILP